MKTHHFDSRRPGMLMFAPPDAGASATPPAISAENSPTGAPIPAAPKAAPKPAEIIEPAPATTKPTKQKGIVDVKKALGLTEKPRKSLDREAQEIAKRATSKTNIPVPPIKTAEERAAEKSEAAKILAQREKEDGDETPEVKLTSEIEPKVELPAKIKIGDKEMTPEEITARFEELEKKAMAPKEETKPAAEVKPAAPAKTPEETAAETKKADDDFIARNLPKFTTNEKDLDVLLSGGPKAVEMFARVRAQDQLETRKWLENTLNPILEDLRGSIDPVVQMHQEVEQYQREGRFLTKHADLKANLKTVRAVRQALEKNYGEQFSKMTEDQQFAEIDTNVRAIITELGNAAPAAPAAAAPNAVVPPKPKPKAPTPPAPTGNVGGGGAPKVVNEQASQVSALMAFEQRGRRV